MQSIPGFITPLWTVSCICCMEIAWETKLLQDVQNFLRATAHITPGHQRGSLQLPMTEKEAERNSSIWHLGKPEAWCRTCDCLFNAQEAACCHLRPLPVNGGLNENWEQKNRPESANVLLSMTDTWGSEWWYPPEMGTYHPMLIMPLHANGRG